MKMEILLWECTGNKVPLCFPFVSYVYGELSRYNSMKVGGFKRDQLMSEKFLSLVQPKSLNTSSLYRKPCNSSLTNFK